MWQSPDPILAKYLPTGDKKRDKNLPGMGGVFTSGNLNLFAYTHQNPVKYVDPNGNETISVEVKFRGVLSGDGINWQPNTFTTEIRIGEVIARDMIHEMTHGGMQANAGVWGEAGRIVESAPKPWGWIAAGIFLVAVGLIYLFSSKKTGSSKNEKHGDGGKAQEKADKQIEALEKEKKGLPKKESKKIQDKINKIRKNAQKNDKGTEDTNRGKRK